MVFFARLAPIMTLEGEPAKYLRIHFPMTLLLSLLSIS